MSDDELDGACCGTCAHAAEVASGRITHPPSPPLLVGASPTFLVARHRDEVKRAALSPVLTLKVGRSKDCDIAFADGTLSRLTCELEVTGSGEVWVKDLRSSCGTFVNGRKVLRSRLHERDEIRVGNAVLTFERG